MWRAVQAYAFPPGTEPLGLELRGGVFRREACSAGEGTPGSAVGTGQSAEGGAHRQPVGGHARPEEQQGRAINAKYEAVLAHYGVEHTRTNPRSSHENGVVEQGHRRPKNRVPQALILRGSRDFESEREYVEFIRRIVDRRNRPVRSKPKRVCRHLRPLPPAPVPEYVNYSCRVRRWSTIRVANRTYSVPSRLIGMGVNVH